jgi:hypothetical protein
MRWAFWRKRGPSVGYTSITCADSLRHSSWEGGKPEDRLSEQIAAWGDVMRRHNEVTNSLLRTQTLAILKLTREVMGKKKTGKGKTGKKKGC